MLTLDQLKRNVFPGESGGDYGALYGYANRPGGPFAGVNLQDMTVNEVLQFTDPSGPYAQWVKGQVGHVATPVGAFQTVGSTLRDAVKNMGLTGNEKFNQPVQDAIGMWIYQNQGPQAWVGWGKGGGNSAPSNNGGQPMGLLSMSTSGMPEQPKPTFWDKLGEIGPMLMMMDPSTRDAGVAFAEMNAVKAGKAEQKAASNRTIEWLRSQAAQYPQLAPLLGAAESGSVDMGTVVNTAFQVIQEASKPKPPVDLTGGAPAGYMWKDPNNQALGVVPIPGVAPASADPQSAIAKLAFDLRSGNITQEQYDMAVADMMQGSGFSVTTPDGTVVQYGTPAGGRPPTEGQLAGAGYLQRMTAAEQILRSVERLDGVAAIPLEKTLAVDSGIEGYVLNPTEQRIIQAQRDWVRAKLRKESGAVIAPAEMAAEIKTYFPLPGEGPEVIKQKAAARRLAERQLEIGAGSAAPQAGSISPEYASPIRMDDLSRAGISTPQAIAGAPAIGTVEDGYRYKGGDPADPASWEQVQ